MPGIFFFPLSRRAFQRLMGNTKTDRVNSHLGDVMISIDKIAVFAGLGQKELALIYNIAEQRRFAGGDVILKEGDKDKTLFLIVEGEVSVYKNISGAKVPLDTLGPGYWVGEAAMLRDAPRMATAVAVGPVQLLAFTPAAFASLPEKLQLHIQKYLLALAGHRLDGLLERVTDGAGKIGRLGNHISRAEAQSEACTNAELIQNIIKKIPKLPRYATELAGKLMDDSVSMADIGESIKTDPSLTSLLLKSVNSPFYGLREKVADIHRAFIFLGTNQVYQIVMASGIKGTMPPTKEFARLQHHSCLVSLIAAELAPVIGRKELAGMGSTIGLLHDIGKAVTLLMKRRNPQLAPFIGLLHTARLGEHLLQTWELPPAICTVIGMQEQARYLPPERLPRDMRDHIALLHVAHACAGRLEGGEDEAPGVWLEEYLALLAGKPVSLDGLLSSRLIPALVKSKKLYPKDIGDLIENAERNR